MTNGTTLFVDDTHSHIELTGTDRAKFLHNFCTNDILRLTAGQGCEAFVCNVKGRTLGLITVFIGENSLWLESVSGAAPGLMAHLDRYLIREDVQLVDRSADVSEILLCGPQATATLSSVVGEASLSTWPLYQSRMFGVDGIECRIARVDWLGDPTWLLIVPRNVFAAIVARLEAAGAVRGTADLAEALRIDAGFPQFGRDISEDHLAQEVGRTSRSISFTKGCYLGQEPIARLDALGHTNRELRRLQSDSPLVAGSVIRDAEGTQDIGVITSAAQSPEGAGSVALGYLKSRWTAPGTRVVVESEGERAEAVVR